MLLSTDFLDINLLRKASNGTCADCRVFKNFKCLREYPLLFNLEKLFQDGNMEFGYCTFCNDNGGI